MNSITLLMKALPFTIPKPKRDALILQENLEPSFYGLLHQHEEFQISCILAGEGTLIVGDSIHKYMQGDVYILDGNLPHVFRSDTAMLGYSHMKSIFFSKSSFGKEFFRIEELKPLQSFFKKAENGFKITSKQKQSISLLEQLFKASKLDRFILFIQLLKNLNRSTYTPLSHFVSEKKYSDNEGRRMSTVIEYTMANFQKEITLNTIALKASMTKTSFCKYFKKRTNKTYISFLNELRIEEACKLMLAEKEISIASIAEASGFQNISNFNRKFKQIKGITPRDFRRGSEL